jgi:hypothetical protein
MTRLRRRRAVAAAAIVAGFAAGLAVALLAPGPAAAEVARERLERRVAEEFGARVLKIERGTLDGTAVLLVTMMREGGNDNAAFKVDTVAFDAESGAPLRGAVPDRRGSESLPTRRTGQTEKRPDVLRDRPWR